MVGLYNKFLVRRGDGRDMPGHDKENARYIVLDVVHDKFALAALKAYGNAMLESLGDNPDLEEYAIDITSIHIAFDIFKELVDQGKITPDEYKKACSSGFDAAMNKTLPWGK